MVYRFRFLFYGILAFIFLMTFALFFSLFSDKGDPISYGSNKRDLNGIFTLFEGKIYAMVPSNGYYELSDANPDSFQTFQDTYQDSHIGFDDRHVYAGNIIMKGLDPKKLKSLGNNYYSDGETTYHCARNSENNDNLSVVGFIIGKMGQSLGLSGKPQNYWYPFVEMPGGKIYQSKSGFALAVNESTAFFRGIEMKNANPSAIRPIKTHYRDGDVRESDIYFTDGKNVYFQNSLLPVQYNETIQQIDVEGDIPSRSAFLIDSKNGMVYVNGIPFDDSKAPYRMLGMNLKHAYQVLFVSKEGLYFYNTETEKAERAGDNPFADNQFQEIAPDVFTSGNKVYFLKAEEYWRRNRGLQSRTTLLLQLEGVQASDFKKISHPDSYKGSIWQAGNRYFYFDGLGSSQLIPSAVYEIKDMPTVKFMADAGSLSTDAIRNLIRDNKITAPEGETILKAVTESDHAWYQSYWMIPVAVVLVYVISFLFRNVKVHPFFIKDGYLIINNLLFKKYPIGDIDKVVFSCVKTNSRVGGYSGKMQMVQKNGKRSRNFLFSSRLTLVSESESKILSYIRELQKELRSHGIDSELI
ncbi:DKNYY domain-containing protein [Chryseobacterium caseinilyticum]|uniref:DKNYY domain-containing protein n=1 Tax=Chryseobacterium caseinilyticum TaxID=2771428 RepID=A0ABR8Z6N2_9FLAO|nr:DKNYY domain-containing protein [Chryseobacterium caseinilyticum]MBD8080913.1 DKNYY domain-containing protein [Chryseobacterium caseinilyticum]